MVDAFFSAIVFRDFLTAASGLAGSCSSACERRRMTKSELIQRLAESNLHLFQRDVDRIISTIFDQIVATLSRGDRVEIRGFGTFSVKRRRRAGAMPAYSERKSCSSELPTRAWLLSGALRRDCVSAPSWAPTEACASY